MKSDTSRPGPPGYWALVAAGEPFRLLFPLGAAIAIFGVLLWPLFVWNFLPGYPGTIHARIMIEGFLTSFVVGFLGTALPRLLDVPRLGLLEALGFALALVGVVVLHVLGRTLWADSVFLLVLCGLLAVLGVRFRVRKDTPPPSFVLVLMGLASAFVGVGVLIASQLAPSDVPNGLLLAGRLLLFQGYLLLPIMGIGAFLLPRFFGQPGRQNFPESLSLPPGWLPRAGVAFGCGATVVAGFFLEAAGEIRWGMALRAIGVMTYFLREIPFHRSLAQGGSLVLNLRLALVAVPVGYALMAVWPEHVFSFLHVVLITGFGLLTFTVATRVIWGHGGQSHLFAARRFSVLLFSALFFLAMLTRVTADWMPERRMSHYAYAAVALITGILVWAVTILPGVRNADD